MTAGLLVVPGAQPSRDRNGRAVQAELRFYAYQTTTPATVYTDEALTVPHAFPILSDSSGNFELIWADTSIEFTANWSTDDGQSATYDGISASTGTNIFILEATEAARDEAEQIAEDFGDLETGLAAAEASAAAAAASAGTATTQAGIATTKAGEASASATLAEYWAGEAEAQAGGDYQASDADLSALAALATTGILARTGSATYSLRTLTAPAAGITVTNGSGVSGNPTLVLANDLAGVEGLATTGLVRRTGDDTWTAGTTVATAEVTDGAITYAKMQDVSATSRFLGRVSSGSGDVEELTASDANTILGTLGKQSLYIPAGAMVTRTTNGAAAGSVETSSNKVMLTSLDFDTTTVEYAQFSIRMPKSWDEGTVTFIPVWSHASTTTNFGVAWSLAGLALSNDDAADAAFGTAQVSVDTGGTTNDIYHGPESSAITIAGSPAAEDWVVFQISRATGNGSDNMAVDARLHGITLFLTNNAGNDA